MSNLEKKTVKKVSDFLKNVRHPEMVIELSETARTAQDAANALLVPVGAIVKSLLFIINNENKEIPVVTLIAGDKKCKIELISKVLDVSGTVRRPNAEEVKKITGYSIGGVSPIGLSKSIKLIIDTSLKRFDKIWSAAGHPHCVFSASFTQLKDITGALETEKLTE
jgi:prolyl-tRNA editing enzyme YbaK/EbsC (Cys-tRNA(Pro) deacylase)|tara:strand:+ start:659 stop:1156 length:498 start_codon:yes stop_codon:yes gene_type:complete